MKSSPTSDEGATSGDGSSTVGAATDCSMTSRLSVGAIRIDSPREILVNKLCALLSRSEVRDLVDIVELEKLGFSIEAALPLAAQKDAGFTPSQLAWILQQVRLGDDARIPGGASVEELRRFVASLIERLRRAAYPAR